jgi:hypothetical protein
MGQGQKSEDEANTPLVTFLDSTFYLIDYEGFISSQICP